MLYPTYVSGRTGERTTVEAVLDDLEAARAQEKTGIARFVDDTLRPVARRFLRRP